MSFLLTAFSLLFASWVFAVWMDPERVCIDSAYVQAIQIRQQDQPLEALPTCHVLSRLAQPKVEPEYLLLLQKVVHRMDHLPSLVGLLPRGWQPVVVTIDFSHPFILRSESSRGIIIGSELLLQKGSLEKIILFKLLDQIQSNNDHFALEVAAEFLSAVAVNDFSLEDPYTHQPILDRNPKWLEFAQTFRQYCYSDLRSPFHFEYCTNQNGLIGKESDTDLQSLNDISILGFRSFFSYGLWRMYQSVPLDEKEKFITTIISRLQGKDFSYPSEVEHIKDLSHWSLEFLNEWIEGGHGQLSARATHGVLVELGLVNPLKVDIVFDQKDFNNVFQVEYQKILKNAEFEKTHNLLVALPFENGLRVLPSQRELGLSLKDLTA
ncbi:MAG: hypothetical protein KDD34_09570, partial [Bdellovibrionales bacterium]|nr:hypothetical protein [Bdellovibrionales bacterium]